MKMKKSTKCLSVLLAIFALCLCAFSPVASALVDKNGSITLNVADSETGTPLPGVKFRLYLFASAYVSGDGVGFKYVIPYDGCNMDMDNLQDAYLPIHLTYFAIKNNLEYTLRASDENGHVLFENLVPGVYLIVPDSNIPEYYMPSPFVINIPVFNKENNNWVYDINATPKMQLYYTDGEHSTTYISVKKIWDTQNEHPASVTVSLLCDYRLSAEVVLNESNGWHYRWDNLSTKHNWSVVEAEVPDGYKVSYDTSSNTVTIINKQSPSEDTPTTQPQQPTTEAPSSQQPTTEQDELADTGQLNWPVPVLSVAGLLLFSIGWALLNLNKKDEEAV